MNRKEHLQNAKKNAHFNVIDAFIIIVLIAAVLGIYLRFNLVESLSHTEATEKYNVSFSVENIRYTTPSYVNVGDKVYFGDTGEVFGTLISESENQSVFNITPSSEFFIDSAGAVVEVFYPDSESRIDAKGRIECDGTYSEEGGFCVGGSRFIAPGQTVEIKTELVTLVATITSIDMAE